VPVIHPALTDAQLVESARGGARAAFGELIARHQRVLLSLCTRSLGDPSAAEDAAHEAALQALLGLDCLRRPEQFGTWLVGIGLNVCRRMLRSRAGDAWSWDSLLGGQAVREPLASLVVDPAWVAEEHELALRVRQAVQALPAGQRAAVLLFYLAGLSQAEAAAALGVPMNADVPRPLTFTFDSSLLLASGGRLQEVRISRLTGDTFFAETVIQTPEGQQRTVDSRPSDAICLALAAHAPIRLARAVHAAAHAAPRGPAWHQRLLAAIQHPAAAAICAARNAVLSH
jgi:RNA polymerase sigma factor (sigma-70 family)